MPWPDGFMWGTGASSTQCEGAAPASDWWDWEQQGRLPLSGDGNGFAERYAEDFALYAELGLTHHRLSIEWARIEPEQGEYDPKAIAHYRAVLQAAVGCGRHPMGVPAPLHVAQVVRRPGRFWSSRIAHDHWARYVDFVADTFGDLVGGWQPMNETNYYATIAYRSGLRPPGHDDCGEWALVSQAMHLATAEAAVRLKQTGVPVSSIFGLSCEVALDDEPKTLATVAKLRAINWDAGIGLFRDGVLRFPGCDPIERPDLAGSFDLLGFSFYSTIGVAHGSMVPYPGGRARLAARIRDIGPRPATGARSPGRRIARHATAGGRVRHRHRRRHRASAVHRRRSR